MLPEPKCIALGDDMLGIMPKPSALVYDELVVACGGLPSKGKHYHSKVGGLFAEVPFLFRFKSIRKPVGWSVSNRKKLHLSKDKEFPCLATSVLNKPIGRKPISFVKVYHGLNDGNIIPLKGLICHKTD